MVIVYKDHVILALFKICFYSLETQASTESYLIPAGSSIETRSGPAVVDIDLAEFALESLATLTLKLVVEVEALGRARGVALVRGALVDLGLARQAHEAGAAVADEAVVGVWKVLKVEVTAFENVRGE